MGATVTDSCGSLLYGYGKFDPTDSVTIWNTVTPVPHYWITIRVSIIYIDFWRNSSMKLYIDTRNVATSTYARAGGIKNQCAV